MEVEAGDLDLAANLACEGGKRAEALLHLLAANKLDPNPDREAQIRDLRLTNDLYGQRTPRFRFPMNRGCRPVH
jgi:hypothetical protein